MLLPPNSILRFHQGVLLPGEVHEREAISPTPLLQKKLQTGTAFLPGTKSGILGKCQPLFLYFGCASLEEKDTKHLGTSQDPSASHVRGVRITTVLRS